MSKKQNPYHLWLGLPAQLVAPNYFQLLGIDANNDDQASIAASSRNGAQKLLDRLNTVQIKTEAEKTVRDKLKARIVTAHKTLSDPTKRLQYKHALAAKQASKSVDLPVTPPKKEPAEPDIPRAIPLAQPISSSDRAAEFIQNSDALKSGPPIAPPEITEPAAPPADDPFAGISDDEIVRVRPVRARGKRSSVIPIVVALIAVSVIGGVVALLYKFENVFDVLAERTQNNGQQIVDPVANDSAPQIVSAKNVDPDAPLTTPDNFDQLSKSQQPMLEQGKNAPDNMPSQLPIEDFDVPQTTFDDVPNQPARDGAGAMEKNALDDGRPDVELSDDDFFNTPAASTLRIGLTRVALALSNRDVANARRANQRLSQWLLTAPLSPVRKSSAESKVKALEQMIGHVEHFVAQVRSSAIEMPGGQDIQVGELTMALVDASPTEITFRRAGQNEVLPYEVLPTSVAIAVGEQGTKASVPKWNLAQAADMAIHVAVGGGTDGDAAIARMTPLLEQSRDDGYDRECATISQFAQQTIDGIGMEPTTKLIGPTESALKEELADFRQQYAYKNPAFINPEAGSFILDELIYKTNVPIQERVANVREAIAVAARIKDFDSMVAAMDELHRLAEVSDVRDAYLTPVNRVMRSKLSPSEARELATAMLRLCRLRMDEPFRSKVTPKLLSHATQLVEEFKFPELEPVLRQLSSN